MTTLLKPASNVQTTWHAYQWQRSRAHGIADGKTTNFQPQKLTPWATLAAVGVSILSVVMLITIYISMPSTALSASSLGGSTAPPTANPNDSCKCEGHSDQSLWFAYGEEANDYRVTSFPVTYPVNAYIEYTLLGDNNRLKPLEVTMDDDDGPTVFIKHQPTDRYMRFRFASEFTLESGTPAFHRKASPADKALFDCLIPDFKTKEAYVFTWVNATLATGVLLGTCQAVVAFAEDSTTYVIKTYGPEFTLPRDNDKPGPHVAFESKKQKSYDTSVTTTQVRGTRYIIAASEPVFGDNLVRVKEQKYGPC